MARQKWLKGAVATAIGWAHPVTGEQLTSTKGLDNPVSYYVPNAKDASFLDPNGATNSLLSYTASGKIGHFAILTKKEIDTVAWDFGDSNTGEGKFANHTYANAGSYTVEALVNYADETSETLTATAVIGEYPAGAIEDVNFSFDLDGTITISWSQPTDDAGGIQSYRVRILDDNYATILDQTILAGDREIIFNYSVIEGNAMPSVLIEPKTIDGLVRRFEASGDMGSLIIGIPQPIQNLSVVPSAPTVGEVTVDGDDLVGGCLGNFLVEGAVDATELSSDEYVLVVQIDGGAEIESASRPLVLGGFVDKTAYDITAFYKNIVGNGAAQTVRIVGGGYPDQIQFTGLTPGAGSLTAIWQAPAYQGASAVTEYKVELLNAAGDTVLDTKSPNPTVGQELQSFAGLDNQTLYRVRITAINGVGEGVPYVSETAQPQ